MNSLFLAPHNDDETLFGAFTILRHQPHVIVCLKSAKQEAAGGPTASERETETGRALWWLGSPTWEQWQFPDDNPPWKTFLKHLERYALTHPEIGTVWAPAQENMGHEQHTGIGIAAVSVFGERVIPYLTYQRGYGRSTHGRHVPFEPQWVMKKLRAMSCYESQFSDKLGTMPWFVDEGLREFYEQ